jgi:hypothetical protein
MSTDDIEVDNSGWHAAMEALMMEDPHPKGYICDSPVARLSRALYAYEWAKKEYPVETLPDGAWSQALPMPGKAIEAVKAMELRDE